jgi:hypothetical protein
MGVGVDVGAGVDMGIDVDVGVGVDAGVDVDVGIGVARAASRQLRLSSDPTNHINPTTKIITKTTRGTRSVNDFGTTKPRL